MTSVKLDVYWSPNSSDKFIAWGAEISLYQVLNYAENDPIPAHFYKLSSDTAAYQIASLTDVAFAKCISWYPIPDPEGLLAIGYTNGRVSLSSFAGTSRNVDPLGLTNREFPSKHNRQCNAVVWGADPKFLAAGFEKHRSEHAVCIWDVSQSVQVPGTDPLKALVEIGLGDSATSLAWFQNQPQNIAVGMNNKFIKLYDYRDASKAQASTSTRAVFGVTADPFFDRRVASYGDSCVCVWDLRNFEKALFTIPQTKSITKLAWCPTRQSFLGALLKDSASLTLYDIQNSAAGSVSDEVEPITLERSVFIASNNETLTSFCWHPFEENRLLAATSSSTFKDFTVVDRITLNWSPGSKIVWNYGKRILQYIDETDPIYESLKDISVVMRHRAAQNYGLTPDFSAQAELMQDPNTRGLWNWVAICRKLASSGSPLGTNFTGIRAVLHADGTSREMLKSELVLTPWVGVESSRVSSLKVYRCEERFQALRLCGWPFTRDAATLEAIMETLEMGAQYSRAAALAIFHMRIKKAIKLLTRAGQAVNEPAFQLVAMALAGFTDDRNALWQEMCSSQRSTLSDPYLRAAFAFLTNTSEKYEHVLNETGMTVQDRVGFACTYLSDNLLAEYMEYLSKQLIEEGNLDGLLLTGLSEEGLNLLQSYVDRTGDIQTVSLLCLHASTHEATRDARMQQWISSYKSLLDSWRLWTQRAKFEVQLHKGASFAADKVPTQVYVSCNFCGKNISVFSANKNKPVAATRSNPSTKQKQTAGCPNCRKPLPRCSICLMHLGTAIGPAGGSSPAKALPGGSTVGAVKTQPFASWILWCQTCRHGGHSSHLLHWFAEHQECPVTGCCCRCFSHDTVGHRLPSISRGND